MRNFVSYALSLLFLFSLLSLSVGCGTDDDDIRPGQDDPNGEGSIECRENFVYEDARDTCVCPEGNLLVDSLICRPPQPGDWYSDMAGCYSELGIIVNLDDRREEYNPNTDTYYGRYRLLTTDQHDNTDFSGNGSFRRYPGASSIQTDSIYFNVFFPGYYADFVYDEETGRLVEVIQFEFRGYYVDDSTIRGFFYFGEQAALMENEYIERCPAVFNKY